ncbi:MAG: hypothetical protein AAFO07_25580 [Bacteroidota bacterium]
MKKQLLLVIPMIFLMSMGTLHSQTNPKRQIDRFFDMYRTNPEKAIDFIFSLNPIFEKENKAQADNVKTKLLNAIPLLGKYYSNEKISEKWMGGSLTVATYMVKYERQPIRFTFKFYKPLREFILLGFSFDDNLGNELEQAAKYDAILYMTKDQN